MLELEDEISPEWSSPPDGFNDDLVGCDDQKIVKAAMSNMDSLFKFLDVDTLLNVTI